MQSLIAPSYLQAMIIWSLLPTALINGLANWVLGSGISAGTSLTFFDIHDKNKGDFQTTKMYSIYKKHDCT